MTIYTVHLPRSGTRPEPSDETVFAPDAFSWGAFLFGPLWLAARRLWLWLAVWILVAAAFVALAAALPGLVAGSALFAGAVLAETLLGFEAQELRRRRLERAGRPAAGVVWARGSDAAAGRFFRRWTTSAPTAGEGARSRHGADAAARPPMAQSQGFLTLFPDERTP